MSMTYMVRAMKTKVGSPLKKLILLKLADNANDNGECWPSFQHIADHCEISRRTVIRNINEMEGAGIISVAHRKGGNGSRSNIFKLNIGSDTVSPPLVTECHPPSDTVSPPPSDRVSPRTYHSSEPINEPKEQERCAFAQFWDGYPKKVDKKRAEIAFNRLPNKKRELAIKDCANRYAGVDKRFIPNPSTYLNGERWEDEKARSEVQCTPGYEPGMI